MSFFDKLESAVKKLDEEIENVADDEVDGFGNEEE